VVSNKKNLEKIIFVNKKWPSDLRDGCKLHSNLAKLIQTYLGFEEELKKIEGSFEREEIVDI
jgi:hypothetical protein